jgi:hypothetical protein
VYLTPTLEDNNFYTMSESFHVNMSYTGSVVLKGGRSLTLPNFGIFGIISPLKRNWPFHVQFRISFTKGRFVLSLIEIGLLVLEKILFNINTCEYGFPYCGPIRPPGTMIWTNLNLHYTCIRKLSFKYDLLIDWLCIVLCLAQECFTHVETSP